MDLVSFSLKTKGARNFARRLRTVFSRFGFSETQTRRGLYTMIRLLQQYDGAPTFFIPAVVLRRHPGLIKDVALHGAEIGVHGYVHADYRLLKQDKQFEQTRQAVSIFEQRRIAYRGFRNPYLGWNEDALHVFSALGFAYESNEAVAHDVIDLNHYSPAIKNGYAKSLALYQALPCNAYTLRPHFEGSLLRIPISIPDDEMLLDRLRIRDMGEVGRIWSAVMQRVYDSGGLYTLNLHPERAKLSERALLMLLSYARCQPQHVWVTRLCDISQWWQERSQFRLDIKPLMPGSWRVTVDCSSRATLLARYLRADDMPGDPWSEVDFRLPTSNCVVHADRCPCIGLSVVTTRQVAAFLQEQGYPCVHCAKEEAQKYTCYFDLPQGLGTTREEQVQRKNALLRQIEELEAPLLHFGCWPDGSRAALVISGDIDSVTIQDFFLRVLEVWQHT